MSEIKYEKAITELEEIVSKMESGQMDLDDITANLKKAQKRITLCKNRLTKTDDEIQRILLGGENKTDE